MQAIRFCALAAATSFDYCYNDYYAIEGRPGFWRKTIPGRDVPVHDVALVEAEFEGHKFIFVRDDQAHEELSQFIEWASAPLVREDEERRQEEEKRRMAEEQNRRLVAEARKLLVSANLTTTNIGPISFSFDDI